MQFTVQSVRSVWKEAGHDAQQRYQQAGCRGGTIPLCLMDRVTRGEAHPLNGASRYDAAGVPWGA